MHIQTREYWVADWNVQDICEIFFLAYCFQIDINECQTLADACHKDAYRTSYNGSFTCTCVSGYTGNGTVCIGRYHSRYKVKAVVFTRSHSLCVTFHGRIPLHPVTLDKCYFSFLFLSTRKMPSTTGHNLFAGCIRECWKRKLPERERIHQDCHKPIWIRHNQPSCSYSI